MSQGVAAAGDTDYLLFTDADIAYGAGAVTGLARAAADGRRGLVSQMALLRADTGWERVLVPAFVYFFAQLYPFRRVNGPGRTAAAAGGCMLVRRDVLAAAGGLAEIRGARIDDVALGRLLKRQAGARSLAGADHDVTSTRPYDQLSELWNMVARSAYTQLRYSPAAVLGTSSGWPGCTCCRPRRPSPGWPGRRRAAGATAWWLAGGRAGGLGADDGELPADAAALPAVAAARPRPAADRRHVRGHDRGLGPPPPRGPRRRVEGPRHRVRPRLAARPAAASSLRPAEASVPSRPTGHTSTTYRRSAGPHLLGVHVAYNPLWFLDTHDHDHQVRGHRCGRWRPRGARDDHAPLTTQS